MIFPESHRDPEMLVENVKAGIAAYRAKNQKWGRPSKAQKHKEKACQLKADGRTIPQICDELGISRSSVYRLLA
jgi:DNA invertase Pin-like site-specific DNA recombinase